LQDRATIFLNACLLFVVLFYVYPLKFVAEGIAAFVFGVAPAPGGFNGVNDLGTLFVLYGGGFVAIFTFVSALYRHAWSQRRELGLTDEEAYDARFYARHYAIFIGVGLVSMLLSWLGWGLSVGLPGWIYASLGPLCYLHGNWSNRRRPAQEEALVERLV
ncbi:MAG TPA: hypothetical protein VF190_00325, partial [Rhodothermales bacterium]